MNNYISTMIASLTLTLFFSLQTATAHEFIVKPIEMKGNLGHTLPIQVISAHVFMESEELEPAEQVEVYSLTPTSRINIPLKINEKEKILTGDMKVNGSGTYILCGHRKGMIWTKTTQGWKQDSKRNLTGVISSGMYEKFSKAIISTDREDLAFRKPVGHKLEIVPLDNPNTIQPGKEIRLQVLYNDTPLTTEVYATYDGFSTHPNTYAYYSSSDGEGQVAVKITQQGTWMVRVEHEITASTEDYDKQVLRAVLLFGVNG